ncbi:hypothetical protein Plhal304r1_c095g0173351 [Plasmopara halstedii]
MQGRYTITRLTPHNARQRIKGIRTIVCCVDKNGVKLSVRSRDGKRKLKGGQKNRLVG